MSRMSELHDALGTIHTLMLGARKLAVHGKDMTSMNCDVNPVDHAIWTGRLAAIEDLILEFEAAGVEWPDNVVEFPSQENGPLGRTVTTPKVASACNWPSACGCRACAYDHSV